MNQPPEPRHDADAEDALFAFGDQPHASPSNELEATLRRVQRAASVTGPGSSAMPTDLKHQIWENLMHAHTMSTIADPFDSAAPRADTRSAPTKLLPWQPALHQAANALLAAALILALTAGIWRATGGVFPGFGDDPQPPTIPFGAAVIQNDGSIDPATLPTAEDCTVEPLTVDEVLWNVQEPDEAKTSTDIDNPATPSPDPTPATPPARDTTVHYTGPASEEDIAAIDAQQRMLMSCILADSWFQIWALEDPRTVSEQVLRVVPPLSGVAGARAILEDLEANGPAENDEGPNKFYAPSAIGYSGLRIDAVTVIDTDPENTWQEGNQQDGKPSGPGDFSTTTGYTVYSEDGAFLESRTIDPDKPYSNAGCTSFLFIWNEARGIWLFFPALHCA